MQPGTSWATLTEDTNCDSGAKKSNPELNFERITKGFRAGGKDYPGIPIDDFETANLLFYDVTRIAAKVENPVYTETVETPLGPS
jgi:hypothetical protein